MAEWRGWEVKNWMAPWKKNVSSLVNIGQPIPNYRTSRLNPISNYQLHILPPSFLTLILYLHDRTIEKVLNKKIYFLDNQSDPWTDESDDGLDECDGLPVEEHVELVPGVVGRQQTEHAQDEPG